MNRAEKAKKIVKVLAKLYPSPKVPLDHYDAFSLLVAVVLSAQTTDKKVNQVTPELMKAAPAPHAMASLPVPTIQAYIREVGLAPQKAKALQGLADKLVREHGGKVPRGYEALEALPGVGHKTASVMMAQWFKEPAFPVDTHSHRLAERWGLSSGKNVTVTEADLKKAFDPTLWNVLHLQIIYFGREHCPALRHDAAVCPICSFAGAKSARTPAKKPAKKK